MRTGRVVCCSLSLLLVACVQGSRPAAPVLGPDSGASSNIPDAGPAQSGIPDAALGVDAGTNADYLLRCASDAIDGGWDVYRVDVIGVPPSPDAGDESVDGSFTLRASLGPMHSAAAGSLPFVIAATGTSTEQANRVYEVNVTFDGGLLQIGETYIPPYLEGQAQVDNNAVADVVCWEPMPWQWRYQYDSTSGLCETEPGNETTMGVNFAFLTYIRETGDGQCAGLSGDLTEGDPTHPNLSGWDLRGAQFGMASLHSANLLNARLEGADLSGLDYESATITGSVDVFTKLPPGCTVTGTQLSCSR